jgi:hypothetical protein
VAKSAKKNPRAAIGVVFMGILAVRRRILLRDGLEGEIGA